MNLKKLIFTENACYKTGQTITPRGIMVHSTGANNPKLSRYVGPDDGLLGRNPNNNHWNTLKPDGRDICPHAFIGLLANGTVATYQVLPWNHRGWHSASGNKGSANGTHIGFEICEDGLADAKYFAIVYQESAELCAMLCKEYKLDPLADGVIIGHYEGYKLGIASNHADPAHWFSRHGKTIDDFRKLVKQLMNEPATPAPPPPTPAPPPGQALYRVQVGAYASKANAESALARAKALGFKDAFMFRQ